jgi:hypothetical protein
MSLVIRTVIVMLGVAVTLCSAAPATLTLKKHPNSFDATKHIYSRDRHSLRNAVPMNGGVLTLGAYFTSVVVGTGAGRQTFDAIVDTGSSNTALPSVGCASCGTPAAQLYNAQASPTALPLSCGDIMCQNCAPTAVGSNDVPPSANLTRCLYGGPECDPSSQQCRFSISYGGSSSATAGTTTMDVACVGGLCAMSYVNQILEEYPADTQPAGIVGFAYPANACNPTCQPTILDSLVAGGALEPQQNTFGMCLTASNGGIIDLGATNASRYYGPLFYTPIVAQKWFNIEVRDIQVGGVSIGVPSFFYQIRNDAIGSFVDSGTSVFLVSPFVFQEMQSIFTTRFSTVPNVRELFLDGQCVTFTNATEQIGAFPAVSVVLAGADGQEDFSVSMTGADYVMPSTVPVTASTQYCLGISGVPSIGVILGDIIMQNYYIEFNRFSNMLGFAPIRSCTI